MLLFLLAATLVFQASGEPWYKQHYQALTKGITGEIGKWPPKDRPDLQSYLILPGVDPDLKIFPVAVNGAGQPTIVAGLHGKGRFVLSGNWDQFYEPQDEHEEKLAENTLDWLMEGTGKTGAEAVVAIRGWTKVHGHKGESDPNRLEPENLDPAKHDIYSLWTKDGLTDEQVNILMDWMEQGKGLLMVGDIRWYDSNPTDIIDRANVNKVAMKLGAIYAYLDDKNAKGFVPGPEPPGELAFFCPFFNSLSFDNPSMEDAAMKRFVPEAAVVLNKNVTSDQAYDRLFQDIGGKTQLFNKKETAYFYSQWNEELLPAFLLKDDITPDAYKAAWDIKSFPYDIEDSAESLAEKTLTFAEDTSNDLHYGTRLWFSTGLYAKGGEVITMIFDGPLLNSGAQIIIGQHRHDQDVMPERSRLIIKYFDVVTSPQQFANPWGGPIYIRGLGNKDMGSTKITIKGGYEMVTFKLDEMADTEFAEAVGATKVPWVEIQAPGWISFTVPTTIARTMNEPTKVMNMWRHKMKVVSAFAGYGESRPGMERFVLDPGVDSYYGAYPIEVTINYGKTALTYETFFDRKASYWGAFHEIGHRHQESPWSPNQFSECTVNWFSAVLATETEGITDESYTCERKHRLNHFNKNGKKFSDLEKWYCLDSYTVLADRFGWDVFGTLMEKYQKNTTLWDTPRDDTRYGTWALEFSKAVGKNVCKYFQWFNWPMGKEFLEACAKFPDIEPDLLEPLIQPEVTNTATCDEGWYAFGDACFYESPELAGSWLDAQERCKSKGGELASCMSAAEMFQFAYRHQYEKEENNMATWYWIGLHDRDSDFKIRWLNGKEVNPDDITWDSTYNPYKPEPYEGRKPGECAYFKNGFLRLGRCSYDDTNYICKKGGADKC